MRYNGILGVVGGVIMGVLLSACNTGEDVIMPSPTEDLGQVIEQPLHRDNYGLGDLPRNDNQDYVQKNLDAPELPPFEVPVLPSESNEERITEDDPRWDCETMGNKQCGSSQEVQETQEPTVEKTKAPEPVLACRGNAGSDIGAGDDNGDGWIQPNESGYETLCK